MKPKTPYQKMRENREKLRECRRAALIHARDMEIAQFKIDAITGGLIERSLQYVKEESK